MCLHQRSCCFFTFRITDDMASHSAQRSNSSSNTKASSVPKKYRAELKAAEEFVRTGPMVTPDVTAAVEALNAAATANNQPEPFPDFPVNGCFILFKMGKALSALTVSSCMYMPHPSALNLRSNAEVFC